MEDSGRPPWMFRNAMDPESIRDRLITVNSSNPVYTLVVAAVGHQSAFTVDSLSYKLKAVLPALIAGLAAEVEQEQKKRHEELKR